MVARGFENIQHFGGGGADGGRDVVAHFHHSFPFAFGEYGKWLVQCKHLKKFPTVRDIREWVEESLQHEPDYFLLITPKHPTPQKLDQLNALHKDLAKRIGIRFFCLHGTHLEAELRKNPELLKSYKL